MCPITSPIGPLLASRYRFVRPLGAGVVGAVYEAMHEDLGTRVAVKLLSPSTADALARLRHEACTTARLGHPHIVQVLDLRADDTQPAFVVMELLRGATLADVLRREGPLHWRRAARIGLQVLSALMAAHGAQVVHRALKPQNVFLCSGGLTPELVKVLDFGIANVLAPAPGKSLGPVAYLAPEQVLGADVDARADLYTVGVCLYEAVSGRLPIEAPDDRSRAYAVANGMVRPLHSRRPDVDARFATLVGRALATSRDDRFTTAYEMAERLACILDDSRTLVDSPRAHTR
ncbi:MAG TPA: serine/threonine-protein kinase [Labilithrix sp.]|jgi:serine/threonine-protein kinase